MKSQYGIALVASLLIMVVVMSLGIGSLSLAMMNAKIAENVQASSQATTAAESGLNASILVLSKQYDSSTDKKFPQSFTVPQINGAAAFASADAVFTPTSDRGGYMLTVKGRTTNGGLHQSEVLVVSSAGTGGSTATGAGPLGKGINAEGTVTVNGSGARYIDAAVHGAGGYTLNGYDKSQFKKCTRRNLLTSVCEASSSLLTPALTGTKDKGSYVCNPSGDSSACVSSKPAQLVASPPPIVVDYDAKRNAAIKPCTKTYSGTPLNTVAAVTLAGFVPGAVVCVTGGVNFPNGTSLAGVTIIANNDINFNGNDTVLLSNATLISRAGGVNINSNNLTVQDSQIFSQNTLNFNGNKTSYLGNTTLASKGSITVNGSSSATQNLLGKPTIGLGLIAEGDITLNGTSDWYASMIAAGNVNYNGTSNLYGSIGAKRGFTANGGIVIDSSFLISNTHTETYFEGSVAAVPKIVSRR